MPRPVAWNQTQRLTMSDRVTVTVNLASMPRVPIQISWVLSSVSIHCSVCSRLSTASVEVRNSMSELRRPSLSHGHRDTYHPHSTRSADQNKQQTNIFYFCSVQLSLFSSAACNVVSFHLTIFIAFNRPGFTNKNFPTTWFAGVIFHRIAVNSYQ